MTCKVGLTVIGVAALIGCSPAPSAKMRVVQSVQHKKSADAQTAQLTTFTSYPACCPDSPVYDPNAPTDECDNYSGCDYEGEFAAIGHQSFDYVQSHNLVAFYDDSDPNGDNFQQNYGGKTIRLNKDGNTFDAIIADTCGNSDCDGCCTQNSQGGYLVDMEYWTTVNNIGGPDNASGTIQFQILN